MGAAGETGSAFFCAHCANLGAAVATKPNFGIHDLGANPHLLTFANTSGTFLRLNSSSGFPVLICVFLFSDPYILTQFFALFINFSASH